MSSESDIAIELRGVGKSYAIYHSPADRLWQMLWRGRKKFYNDFWALRDLDLEVRRGETVGIVGRNGAGKSTLLQLVCGILEPTRGSVEIRGRVAALLELGAGFNPEFTGRENVFMNGSILGLSDWEIRERYEDIVEFADIGEFILQPVKLYSSGMFLRLAIAVAFNVDPDILVIDEALAVGDEAFQRKCFARLEEFRRSGKTILFVSHWGVRIVELCHRAVLLDKGRRLLTAAPAAVIHQYQRLMYASESQREEVLRQIALLDGGEDPGAVVVAGRDDRRVVGAGRRPMGAERSTKNEHPGSSWCSRGDTAGGWGGIAWGSGQLDPNLVPKSTTGYGTGGAEIFDVRIEDGRGNRVNVLEAGHRYLYAYEVRFLESATGVRGGTTLKSATGIELGGVTTHLLGKGLELVRKGGIVTVECDLYTFFGEGIYLLNAGIVAWIDGEERHLHRILDATMFRILPGASKKSFGYFDLSLGGRCTVRTVLKEAGEEKAGRGAMIAEAVRRVEAVDEEG